MTDLYENILSDISFSKTDKILDPSFGNGSSIITLIKKFIPLYGNKSIEDKIDYILTYNIFGYEKDELLYDKCMDDIYSEWGYIPPCHNLICEDYLTIRSNFEFDYIIGSPPYGEINNKLYNFLYSENKSIIKRELYCFFIVKSIELLSEDGKLIFVCSDRFKSDRSMEDIRKWLLSKGSVSLYNIDEYLMLSFKIGVDKNCLFLNGDKISIEMIMSIPNFSWVINSDMSKFFNGTKIKDYMMFSNGLNINNEYFLKEIINDQIIEEYDFIYYDDLVTVESELIKSKNNILSKSKYKEVKRLEEIGYVKTSIEIKKVDKKVINLPNRNYKYYNLPTSDVIWSNPSTVIHWGDGDCLKLYDDNINYNPIFHNNIGMTWDISSLSINPRYLPKDYITDSSSPLGILKDGIDESELYFIIGWCMSDKCKKILNDIIRPTKNILIKDIENLPYPNWVDDNNKNDVINIIKDNISLKMRNENIDLNSIYYKINSIF